MLKESKKDITPALFLTLIFCGRDRNPCQSENKNQCGKWFRHTENACQEINQQNITPALFLTLIFVAGTGIPVCLTQSGREPASKV